MILDSSALIVILRDEPEAAAFATAIEAADERRISAANFLEAAVVIDDSRDPVATRRFDQLISEAEVTVAPVTEGQARIARAAYADFGKGSGHPAGLNFGDCFAYALARDKNEPLLFKGSDFIHTDVVPALLQEEPGEPGQPRARSRRGASGQALRSPPEGGGARRSRRFEAHRFIMPRCRSLRPGADVHHPTLTRTSGAEAVTL
ncbi:MAG: type II toxin-antitoxin system VapC family toxin [Streptosporangiaceae bacterium]